MFKELIESTARGRYLLPLVVGFALLGVVVTETSYHRAKLTLDGGIALTDARLKSAALLQALTDHEVATRVYLITGEAAEAEKQRQSAQAVRRAEQEAFDLVRRLDEAGTISMEQLTGHIEAQLSRFEAWRKLAEQGRRDQALRLSVRDDNQIQRDVLRAEFDTVLHITAAVQQTARVSLYDALMLNRLAIHGLMALACLAMLMFARSLRDVDQHKAQEQARLAALVDERTTRLRELAGHLVTAREDERARLARELHDEMGGLMTAMKLEFARLRRVPEMPEGAKARLAAVDARLNEGIALKRRIVEHLRPSSLDQLGLSAALELLCADVAANLGVPVQTQFETVPLAKEAELTIYRLVQESLTNVSKYARCSQVTVSLGQRVAGRVEVRVQDNGKGFDTSVVRLGSHGLIGMRFRVESHGGTLTITSAPGQGTTVWADLPADPLQAAGAASLPAPPVELPDGAPGD
jgi:signal transduction histidine kinase